MTTLQTILIIVGAAIALFLIYVASRPADFKVARSARIAAPQSVVFAQVNNFHKWEAWSPWVKMDPNCKNTYDGPDAGVGAGFAWSGNAKVGQGHMKITDSRPGDSLQIQLDFEKPMKATNKVVFTFQAEGGNTTVTWAMSGKNNFVGKLFVTLMGCDKMIGGQFEKGLADMKAIAEKAAQPEFASAH